MGAEDSTLGLLFEIAADPSKAITATQSFRDQAGKAMRDFEEQMMSTMTKSLGITKEFAVGMAVGTGAVLGLGIAMFELADKASEVGAKIFEVHEKTEMTAESLSGLMALSKQTGESFDTLSVALARAGVNLEKALVDPGSKSSQILQQVMGSTKNLTDLGLKPMDERIQEVLKHIFEMHDAGERNLALQTLLGRGWQTNIETLKLLAEQGYGPAIEAAKRFGVYFDDESSKKAKAFQVEWAQTKMTFESVAQVLGQSLIPFFNTLMTNVLVMTEYLPQFQKAFSSLFTASGPNVKNFENYLANWKSLGQVIKDVEFQINSLVQAGSQKADIGDALFDVNAAKERAKKIHDILVKASIDRTKTVEEIDKKATEQSERRNDEEWKRILARDEISHKAQAQMDKTYEALDDLQTDRSVKRNDEKWKKITDRDEIGIRARAQMAKTWEDLDKKQTDESVRLNNEKWKQLTKTALKYYESVAQTALGTLSEIAGVVRGNHAIEVALIIARGAIKSAEQVAEGMASAAYGNLWAAGMHYASAAAFAGLAGYSAATTTSGSGGGGGGQSAAGAVAIQSGPHNLAPGAASVQGGGTSHVIVYGSDRELANHIGRIINNNVRYGGGQLIASHVNGK